MVTASNSTQTASGRLVAPDATGAYASVVSGINGSLIPAGLDVAANVDAPVDNVLDDARPRRCA